MLSAIVKRYQIIIFLIVLMQVQGALSQDIGGDMMYSVMLMSNPAYSGAEGQGTLKMLYRNYFPGSTSGFGSVYVSYDTYFEPVQGGIGIYISENMLGDILNDMRLGSTYAYHLRAGRDLYINAGFEASLIYRSYNLDNIVFPDQIDPFLGPVLPTQELMDLRSRIQFDVGVGFLLSYRNLNAGISFRHLGKPDLTGLGDEDGRLKRRITLNADAEFETGADQLNVSPLLFANLQGQFLYGAAGACVNYKSFSISLLSHIDSRDGLYALQPGLAFETGRFMLAYNYFFSVFNGRSVIPVTHSNMLTLSLSLNNVDNSSVMKAIKYPKL